MPLFAGLPPASPALKKVLNIIDGGIMITKPNNGTDQTIMGEYYKSITSQSVILQQASAIGLDEEVKVVNYARPPVGQLIFTPPGQPTPCEFIPDFDSPEFESTIRWLVQLPTGGNIKRLKTEAEVREFIKIVYKAKCEVMSNSWARSSHGGNIGDVCINDLIWTPIRVEIKDGLDLKKLPNKAVHEVHRIRRLTAVLQSQLFLIMLYHLVSVGKIRIPSFPVGSEWPAQAKAAHRTLIADYIHVKVKLMNLIFEPSDKWKIQMVHLSVE